MIAEAIIYKVMINTWYLVINVEGIVLDSATIAR